MESINLQNLTLPEFRTILAEEIQNQLQSFNGSLSNSDELIPRLKVAEELGITPTTLHTWTKKGLLTAYKVSGKVFYRRRELLACIVKHRQKSLNYKR